MTLDPVWPVAADITATFEGGNRYAALQTYDSGVVSYGRFQFTLTSRSLQRVLERYLRTATSHTANRLRGYLLRVQTQDVSLAQDGEFKALLVQAADEAAMQQAQDGVVMDGYWTPAMRQAEVHGITTPLGRAFLFDAAVHHGAANSFLERAAHDNPGAIEPVVLRAAAVLRQDVLRNLADSWKMPGLKQRGDWWVALVERGDWNLNGVNGWIEVKPGRKVRGLDVATVVDMLPYVRGAGNSAVYRLDDMQGGGQICQTQVEGNLWYYAKGGDPSKAHWEARALMAANGVEYVALLADTSHGMETYYTLTEPGTHRATPWMPRRMEPGKWYERNAWVRVYWKATGALKDDQGYVRSWIRLHKVWPTLRIDESAGFKNGNGVVLQDVAELHFAFTENGAVYERYFMQGGKLVAWAGSSQPYESFWSKDPVSPTQPPPVRESVPNLRMPEVPAVTVTFPPFDDPRWMRFYASTTSTPPGWTNIRAQPTAASADIGDITQDMLVMAIPEAGAGEGGLWLPVRFGAALDRPGWVHSGYVVLRPYEAPTDVHRIHDVPYFSQLGAGASLYAGDCGPAVLLDAIGFVRKVQAERRREYHQTPWSPRFNPDSLSHWIGLKPVTGPEGYGTVQQLVWALQDFGIPYDDRRDLTPEVAEAEVRRNNPVILLVNYRHIPDKHDRTYTGPHFLLLVGVNSLGFEYHDPYWPGQQGAYRFIRRADLETAITQPNDDNPPTRGIVVRVDMA